MDYSLFSSTGNLIDSFDNEEEARAPLQRIVESEPDAADYVALFVSDDEGQIVACPIPPSAIRSAPERVRDRLRLSAQLIVGEIHRIAPVRTGRESS